jgi:endogenous inhibitor of DNA gyrase (YacG/DUF329 family)
MLLRPILFFLVLMFGAALLWRLVRPLKTKLSKPDPAFAPGVCPRCGYQANVQTRASPFCPECGTVRLSEPAESLRVRGDGDRRVKKVDNQAEK